MRRTTSVLLCFCLLLPGCQWLPGGNDNGSGSLLPLLDVLAYWKSAAAVISSARETSTFTRALRRTKLLETLEGEGPFTVFVPNNEAFGKLPRGTFSDLFESVDATALDRILRHHIVAGRYLLSDLQDGTVLTTLAGTQLTVNEREGQLFLRDAYIDPADYSVRNGVIYVIDAVVMPQ